MGFNVDFEANKQTRSILKDESRFQTFDSLVKHREDNDIFSNPNVPCV